MISPANIPMDVMKKRLTWIAVVCFALGILVVGRALRVQLIKDERLARMAKRQFQSQLLIKPRRGNITDRNQEALAINLETRSLAADPSKVSHQKPTLARLLAKALDLPRTRVLDRLKAPKEFVWLKRHLSEEEVLRLEKLGLLDRTGSLASGLFLVKESKRVYPHGELASQIVGSVNLDTEGLEGIELWGDSQLRGEIVSVKAIKDALGRPSFIDAVSAKDVRDGKELKLTLDIPLQYSVENELRAALERTGAQAGTVMVMDAANGEILAMANAPSFNANKKGAPPSSRRNRAVTDGFEPGSTVKPLVLAGALTQGMKLTDQIYGEQGTFLVQGKRISEAEAHERFEWINLKKVIQVSSNVGAAKLALKLGPDRVLSTLQLFGLGTRTGINFPGEINGLMPARKQWQPLTTANVGFGQGILVTPLQMLRAYAVFANGGWLVQPRLIKDFPYETPRRVLTGKTVEQVVDSLVSVTEEGGTGTKARIDGFKIAGKTGTAQVVDPTTGKYSRSRYIPSFAGFLVGTEKRIVVFASLDGPRGIYYASETAVPLFRAVMESAINRYSIPVTQAILAKSGNESVVKDELRFSLAKALGVPTGLEWQGQNSAGKTLWKMPSLVGLTPREATQILQGHQIQIEVTGSGLIRTQSPDAGRVVADGGTVRFTLGE